MTMSFGEFFQPGFQHLRDEKERQKMDIVQRPATGPGKGPIDLPEPSDPNTLPAAGPDAAAVPEPLAELVSEPQPKDAP
jgi:hypothetical protein